MYKRLTYIIIIFLSIMFLDIDASTQVSAAGALWKKTTASKLQMDRNVHRSTVPDKFEIYELDLAQLKAQLTAAPVSEEFTGRSTLIMEFPTAEGKIENFLVMESPTMEPKLAAKFPMIKTYAAQGIDDPTATMHFSVTQFGLHVMALSGIKNTTYIDPYTEGRNTYMVYDRLSLECGH